MKGYQETWGFPNCGGAIDGTHIPIIAPVDSHGDYLNRKGYYSLLLQGVCDHKYIFRDINIGWPGRVHDARVFANSELFLKGENSLLFPNWIRRVQLPDRESTMPIVLLADPAYPLKPWLMKPFSNRGRLTPVQNTFNYRLSRARMTIENSCGRLKGRWRRLLKRSQTFNRIHDVNPTRVNLVYNVEKHSVRASVYRSAFRITYLYRYHIHYCIE